jgi:hypothetical protein
LYEDDNKGRLFKKTFWPLPLTFHYTPSFLLLLILTITPITILTLLLSSFIPSPSLTQSSLFFLMSPILFSFASQKLPNHCSGICSDLCLLLHLELRSVLCFSSSYSSARCSALPLHTLVLGQCSVLCLLLGTLHFPLHVLSALSSALLHPLLGYILSSSLSPSDIILPLPVLLPHLSRGHRFGLEFSRHSKLRRITPTLPSCTMESAGSLVDCVHKSRLRQKPQTFVS